MIETGIAVSDKRSNFEEAMNRLASEIDANSELVGMLEHKLEIVLQTIPEDNVKSGGIYEESSHLVTNIHNLANNLENVNHILQTLHNRVDL